MALRYVAGVGFVDGDKKLSTQSTYAAQQKREDELKRSQQAAQERAALQHRNAVRSTDAYQSARRGAYANRAETETADFQQSRRNLSDALDNYKRVGERLRAARQAVESGAFGEGTLQYNEAAETLSGLEREYKSALDRYTAAYRDYNSRIQRGPSSPFFVEEMGMYVDAREARQAMEKGFTVHHTGSSNYGADMGSNDLVSVLDRLNEENVAQKKLKYAESTPEAANFASPAATSSRRGLTYNVNQKVKGDYEEDLERARSAEYYANAENRALAYEQETLQNDRSAEYKKPLLSASLFGNETGQHIAHNVATGSADSSYASLNDTERRTILSLAAQERWDDVKDYFDAIDSRVNARVYEKRAENIQNASKIAQVGAGLSGIASSPAAFAEQIGAQVARTMTGEYRPVDLNEGATGYLRLAQTGQQASLEGLHPGWQLVGNAGYSIAQNLAALPLGPAGAAIWLGASAAGQASTEALESGKTLDQAITRGIAAGVIETATEKLGLDNLFKTAKSAGKTGLKSFLGSVLKQAGTEGAEEAISEFANTIFDIVQMGEDSAYEQRYQELVASGMSENEARSQANLEFFVKNPALAAAAGAVSGLLMGGGSTAIQQSRSGKANRELASNSTALINAAMNLTHDDGTIKRESDAFQIADQIARDQRYGKKIDNNRYADLAQALEAEGVTVNDAVAAETARQQEAEAARVAEEEAQAARRAEFEARETAVQEKASSLYREIAAENGLSDVADSPAVSRALSEYYQEVERNGGDFNSDAALEAARRAGNVVLNAYETAVAASEGIDAQVSDDGFGEARSIIGGSPIKISKNLENANPELYERALRTLNVSEDGASVGMVYDGLHEQFSDSFNAESEAAQLTELIDIMQSDDTIVDPASLPEGSDIVDRAEDMARELFTRVRSGALAPVAAQESVSEASGVTSAETQNAPTNAYRASAYEAGRQYTPTEMMQTFTQSTHGKDLNARTVLDMSNVVMKLGVKAEVQDLGDNLKNGFYDHRTGSIVINSRIMQGTDSNATTKSALSVFSHELVHHLRVTGAYKDLVNVVKRGETMKTLLELLSEESGTKQYFKDIVANKRLEYAQYGIELTYQQAEEEVVAEFVAEHYLSNTDQINELVNMDRSLAQRILDWFRDILARLNLSDPGYTEVQKAHAAIRIAMEQRTQTSDTGDGVSFSIGSGTMEDRLLSYIRQYGTLNPGERVQHMDGSGRESGTWQAPKQTAENRFVRRSVQTFANAPSIPEKDRNLVKQMIETVGTYLRIGNRETVQQAREKREQFSSFDQALGAFLSESKDVRVKDARLYVAFGHQLLMESTNVENNSKATWDIMATLEELLTQLGQGVQAASIISRLSPEGRYVRVQRIVNEAIKRETEHLKKAERRENGAEADAANEAAEAMEEAARGIRKMTDDIRRGASDEEISRQIEAIKKDLGEKVQGTESGSGHTNENSGSISPAIERLENKKKGLERKIADVLGSDSKQQELLDLINGTTREIAKLNAADRRQLEQYNRKLDELRSKERQLETQSAFTEESREALRKIKADISTVTREIAKLNAADKRYTQSIEKNGQLLEERIEEWMLQQQITESTKAELDRIRSQLKEVNQELRKARYDEQRYTAEGLRKIEIIAKRKEELLLELTKRDTAREDILRVRAELNEANAELRKAKRQASAALSQYKKIMEALDGVQNDKSSGRYRKAVEAFDLAKQSAKDAKTFAKYAQDNFIQPPKELMERLAKAETVEEQQRIEDQIVLFLAEQTRGTAVEKANSWRYLSMLGNLKTHERNFFSTAASFGASRFKDMVAIGAEKAFVHDKNKKTKAMVTAADRDLIAEADRVFKERADDISGNRQATLATRIQDSRKIWASNDESTRFGRALNAIERPVGKLSDWNSAAMEWEDRLFLKYSFRTSYASIMKARGWTPSTMTEQQKAEAFEYAKKQAQDVTFHTPSAFADWVSRGRNKLGAGAFFLDAVMPFTKTPANVLKAGIDYSPIGLFKTGIKALRKAYDGDLAAFAEDLSKNFTGLTLAGLGMVFAHTGLIVASGDDDDPDRKNVMDKVGGFQSYSLVLGDMSFSLDWLTPLIMPMMEGVELYNAIWGESEGDRSAGVLTRALDVLTTSVNPLFETSMLDGVASAFQSYSNGGKFAWDVIHSIMESYVGQFIPTIFGQVARTIDPVKRSTYSSKDSAWTKSLEQTARRLASKLPGISFLLEPVIDRAGQETPQISANALVRAFAQFVSPGNLAFDQFTGVDEELMRLYDVFGETDVLPKTMPSSVTYKDEKYNLSPTEYTAYAARRGTITYSELESLMASEEYQGMSDEDKHDAVADIIDKGDKEAKAAFLNERGVFNYVMQSTDLEKVQHILEQDWTDDQKFAEFTNQMSEKRNEQIQGLLSDGWTQDDIMQGYVKYAELDKTEGLKASAARAELADFMAKRAQKNFMKASDVTKFLEVFNVGTYMPAQAGSYEKLYASGLSTDVAKKVSDKLLALEPLDGAEDVSDAQRLQAIVSSGISSGEQWKVMEAYYATSEPILNDIAAYKAAGASAAAYAKMYEAKAKIDKEAEAHKDDDSYEGKTYHYCKLIAETAANEAEAEAAYKSFIGDTEGEREKLKPLEEAGIPYSKIVEYHYKTALLTADKDKNGKSISGSKKEKVLREINALPITAAQKDALYLFAGYTSKDIGKTPWH